jgi:type II restriction/modification system DNA methylase subunit YeeA
MQIQLQSPKQSLNKAYLKTKVERAQIDLFKTNLSQFLHKAKQAIERQESEEHLKNLVKDFLKDTYYKDRYEINTRGRADLVIHHGPTAGNTAAVLMEVKRPGNKAEMISGTDLNRKAMQEAVLYYLRERIEGKNTELKYIIITNIYEWYIFNATHFEALFHKNTALKKAYEDWSTGKLVSKNTDLMYEHIGHVLKEGPDELPATFVDLNGALTLSENALLTIYKVFSPPHLLKESFANDSNTLDNRFYQELLHIIGLEEIKEGGKKLIRPKAKPDPGSLYENTLLMLKVEGRIGRLHNPRKYGNTGQEVAGNMALELCITWINRILFLKLLEAQLYRYHQKEVRYRFLKEQIINDFDELNKLFFQVLALKPGERTASIQSRYGHVPYLNSSLFEITEAEDEGIRINSLDDHVAMPVYSGTVLKNEGGKTLKNTEFPSVLPYLLRFLDAYDFGAEGKGEVQEENKTLITASVLGLIFEKINGYKDGSFYTPGFITMYMCRETLRRAVVQKFNDNYGWNCQSIEEINDALYRQKIPLKDANELINSLHICDPAVGSGHFLVSALNELIAIKADLQILMDSAGKRLRYDSISIANDELVIMDSHGDLFEYTVNKTGVVSPEKHLLQEALFREKQHIIENCLFGVDINPNSVKICRLRLWIELLKNAYYTSESGYKELHTLPNIDINIKQGNSLLSRFALDEDLSEVFKKQKYSLKAYQAAVQRYKNTNSKETKYELVAFFKEIKDQFRTTIGNRDPLIKKMAFVRGAMDMIKGENIFGEKNLNETTATLIKNKLKSEGLLKRSALEFTMESAGGVLGQIFESLEAEKAAVEANRIYEGAFEWRFEFPEVLDENGNYQGFDVVIGNPPYIRQEELLTHKLYFEKKFKIYESYADLFFYFYELSFSILRQKGLFGFISNTFDKTNVGLVLREFLVSNTSLEEYIDLTAFTIFEGATTYPVIIIANNEKPENNLFLFYKLSQEDFLNKTLPNSKAAYSKIAQSSLISSTWNFLSNSETNILAKLNSFKTVRQLIGKSFYGIKTGFNEAFIITQQEKDLIISQSPNDETLIKPFFEGKDLKKWYSKDVEKYILFTRRGTDIDKYPGIKDWLNKYKAELTPRNDPSLTTGRKKGPYKWFEIQDSVDYYPLFEKSKIVWPNLQSANKFSLSQEGHYINAPAVIFPSSDKSLLAILNSKLIWYFLKTLCVVRSGGFIEVKPQYFEQIPIPEYSSVETELIGKVDLILEAKKANPKTDTSMLEKEIDQLVYALYGLTEEEIAIVEGEMVKAEA